MRLERPSKLALCHVKRGFSAKSKHRLHPSPSFFINLPGGKAIWSKLELFRGNYDGRSASTMMAGRGPRRVVCFGYHELLDGTTWIGD